MVLLPLLLFLIDTDIFNYRFSDVVKETYMENNFHYLNWFSKTTIIGWHKQLTTKKSIGIVVVWISILICYVYSYRLGLVISIFLSVIHVMLEFPLNMITVRSLFFNKNTRM